MVVIDEPSAGVYYGGQIAAPVAGNILKGALDYLDYTPELTQEEKEEYENNLILVPDLKGISISEASKKLKEIGLNHVTDIVTPKEEDKVIDQIPKAGTEVKKDEIIELYLKNKPLNNNR